MPAAINEDSGDSSYSGDEYISSEEEYDPEEDTIVRAKWMMDGAKTLAEARECLQAGISWLQSLEDDGWELISEINDDWGFCHKKN